MGLLFVKTQEGTKRPSVWVWITFLIILLTISIILVTGKETGLDEMMGNTKKQQEVKRPTPIVKEETTKAIGDLDTQAVNDMNNQIRKEKEDGNGYLDPSREAQIRKKYEDESKARASSNFNPSVSDRLTNLQENPKPITLPEPTEVTEKTGKKGYQTLAERLQAEGGSGGGSQTSGGGKSIVFAPKTTNRQETPTLTTTQTYGDSFTEATNIMPLGTFIACVLDGDIVTSELSAHVWANVVLDVTFRRQLQLPKGLVKIRGKTASEPVQNVVDVTFDTMVFSDGTELPIQGFAYSAFDPRYPHRYRTRGIPGELIVPPMWPKLRSLVYSAALGASDAFIQNYINENTTTSTTFDTTPVINPTTGAVTTQIQQNQKNPVNNQIWGTIGLSAAQSTLEDLVKDAQRDMEKYKPFLIVEKGTPFFIQLDTTVDISQRRVNGTALAKREEMKQNIELSKQGIPMPSTAQVYPPGDARAQYTGVAPTDGHPSAAGSTPGMTGSLDSANQQLSNAQKQLAAASAQAQAIQNQGIPSGSGAQPNAANAAALQQLLQQMK